MKERLVIVGIGNTAEIIYKFVTQYQLYDVMGFTVDRKYINTQSYLSLPVFPIEDLDSVIDRNSDYLFCALMWNSLNGDRRRLYERLKGKGYKFANLISPSAVINGMLRGDNCWVSDYAKIDWNTVIGNDVFVKTQAFIGDNVIVEDHCFVAEHTTIGGGVIIGEQSFVGLGATIFDEVIVGKKCIVGAATTLKRHLPDFSVNKSSRNSYFVKEYSEEEIEQKLLFKKNVR